MMVLTAKAAPTETAAPPPWPPAPAMDAPPASAVIDASLAAVRLRPPVVRVSWVTSAWEVFAMVLTEPAPAPDTAMPPPCPPAAAPLAAAVTARIFDCSVADRAVAPAAVAVAWSIWARTLFVIVLTASPAPTGPVVPPP